MNKMLKTLSLTTVATAVLGISIAPAVFAWGDSNGGRPTYSLNQINNGAIDDKIVFNSIVDSDDNLSDEAKASGAIMPLTDERNFVGARVNDGNHGKQNVWNGNEIEVIEGKTYIVRMYIHNNNPKGEAMTAKDVKAQFKLPRVISKTPEIYGFIDSSNANPTSYWDYVRFKSDRNFYLDYIEGSALFENNGIGKNGGVKLSDDLVKGGVKVGYDQLDGNLPGCYKYAGYVSFEVKPVFEDSSIEKKVRKLGSKDWKKSVDASLGETVEYQIHYKNLNNSSVSGVVIRDSLPNNMVYVPGSTRLYTTKFPNGAINHENTLTTTGVNIGDFVPGGDAYIRFRATVIDKDLACGNNRLINWGKASANGFAVQNSSDVYVTKACSTTPGNNTPGNNTPGNNTPGSNTPNNTTPGKLPSTGPAGIISGIIGTGAVVTTLGYYLASRKQLR